MCHHSSNKTIISNINKFFYIFNFTYGFTYFKHYENTIFILLNVFELKIKIKELPNGHDTSFGITNNVSLSTKLILNRMLFWERNYN